MSIKATLTKKLTVISVVLATLGGLGNLAVFNKLIHRLESSKKNEVDQLTQKLAGQISAQFYERYGDVQAFALNRVFVNGSKSEMTSSLNRYVATYGIYDLVMILDSRGNVLSVNSKSPDGKPLDVSSLSGHSFSNDVWFKNLAEGKRTQDSEHKLDGTLVTDPTQYEWLNQAYGESRIVNSFATALTDENNKTVGYIVNFANFKWATDELKASLNQNNSLGNQNDVYAIVSPTGSTIYSTDGHSTDSAAKEKSETPQFQSFLSLGSLPTAQSTYELTKGGKKTPVYESISKIEEQKFTRSLGWLVLAQRPVASLLGSASQLVALYYLVMTAIVLGSSLIFFAYSRRVSGQLRDTTTILSSVSQENDQALVILDLSARELASSTNEQASAVQESGAALNEMSSMISKTIENVKSSMGYAQSANEKSKSGEAIVAKMVDTVEDIAREASQLNAVSQAIGEIQSKTSMINDIVFKTQLLSFNASIEAARAGAQGRGFAVVAEEVGNLAIMSGAAALDIEKLIDSSKRSVDEMLTSIQGRVKDGQTVSNEVENSFSEIRQAVEQISDQVSNITNAAEQQEIGINEIQAAMVQLDAASQKTSEMSIRTLDLIKTIDTQGKKLKTCVVTLTNVVDGDGAQPGVLPSSSSSSDRTGEGSVAVSSLPLESVIDETVSPDDATFKKIAA